MNLKRSQKLVAVALLPTLVCAWCKIVIRSGAPKCSHGICRPCRLRYFPTSVEPLAA
jgi:hypothetical protein